jgi:hypothetical protein
MAAALLHICRLAAVPEQQPAGLCAARAAWLRPCAIMTLWALPEQCRDLWSLRVPGDPG